GATNPVLLVGWESDADAAELFTGCTLVARIDNGHGVDNDEDGTPVRLCTGPAQPWPRIWPRIRHLG
ncbi:MAG TPA: hypothetical protein VEV65_00420, partial [Kineosporiaceae bacterium]|nr:hypothetical protein [Kineosporiaceae bacterium]